MTTHRRPFRRGTIFVTTMWIIIVITGLALVFSRSMRVEAIASGNRLSYEQAAAIERGAEQYVLATIDGSQGNAVTVTSAPGQSIQLGTGYFWLIRPDSIDPQVYDYGIVDESSKLNLNTADDKELAILPGITQELADSIVDWRDPDNTITGQGGENDYYTTLPEPYQCKNGPFETVEELRLLKNTSGQDIEQILFGYDLNHNGVVDQQELQGGGLAMGFNANNGAGRGIVPYVTVYSQEPNTDSTGAARVNVNQGLAPAGQPPGGNPQQGQKTVTQAPQPAAGNQGGGNNNNTNDPVYKMLATALSGTRLQQVFQKAKGSGQFTSALDFAQKVGLTQDEAAKILDKVTTTDPAQQKTIQGLINVNTAPREVLQCLNGLAQGDVDALLGQRQSADTSSMAWVLQALQPQKIAAIGAKLTGRSFQYSADIVAVSGDGRAFSRVRIVVDCRGTLPKIIYRKELTALDWPLDPAILTALKAGQQLPAPVSSNLPQGARAQ
jgi:type II secretory pathway component PulK